MNLSRKEIALVHIAAQQIGLDDDTYRDVLQAHGGVASSKDLDRKGFKRVMSHFEQCGFVTKCDVTKSNRPGYATQNELNLIRILWHQLSDTYYKQNAETRALRGFLRKRFRIDHERFITSAQSRNVIEAIKAIVTRKVENKTRDTEHVTRDTQPNPDAHPGRMGGAQRNPC